MQALPPDWPGGYWWHWLFFTVVLIAFVLIMVMGAIYIERRGMGRMQSRLGPNRTGPFGLLQPVADAVKVLLKENIVPDSADKIVHWLAPMVAFAPVLMIFAVVPFQNGALLADLNIGILYIVAVSSVSHGGRVHGRVGLQQQVFPARRHAQRRRRGQLRDTAGAVHRRRGAGGRLAVPEPDRLKPRISPLSCCSRWAFCFSSRPPAPRLTAAPST